MTASLVLVPAREPSIAARTRLLGLPLLRRTALAAKRAEFDRVFVVVADPAAAAAALEGTGAVVLCRGGREPDLPQGRIVLLPDGVVAGPGWLRRLRGTPVGEARLCRLGAGAIVETSVTGPLSRALVSGAPLDGVLREWEAALPAGDPVAGVEAPLELTGRADLRPAENRLLKELVKPQDAFLTKHISRKVSLAVTRRLANTPVTPNGMTLFCTFLGLAAAWCFGSSLAPSQFMGGLLFLLHSILDGCDGELARLKFKESRLGGTLDFWGDNIVHVAVFSAFAYAWSAAVDDDWPLRLGAVAVAGTIFGASFVYLHAMRPRTGSGPLLTTVSPTRRSRLTEVLDEVSRRDFIYLVMVLSIFGKGYWFLALAAAGTPAFFLTLLFVALGDRRQHVPAQSRAYD